jgi:5-methyltetrahydrofolate--homocysteine methyltransferase
MIQREVDMSIERIREYVLEFNKEKLIELIRFELSAGSDISTILNDGLISAMDEVGRRFSRGDFYIPEMLLAARTMKAGLELLRPHMIGSKIELAGTIVIGSVKGDLHDIGKNLVSMMLQGAGYQITDLGIDVRPERFIEAAQDKNAQMIALSALVTTTLPAMEETVALVKEKMPELKIIVGGAPVSEAFARRIRADGYSADAAGAVIVVRNLLNDSRNSEENEAPVSGVLGS